MRLTLASASPRRREILAGLGVEFEVVPSDVEELSEGEPQAVVVENALRKARAVAADAPAGALVLGVDTDVVLDGSVLGKAADEAQARARLSVLSGRTHAVLSGVAVVSASHGDGSSDAPNPAGSGSGGSAFDERSDLARSLVTFRELDAATLDLYLASGEWRDRAGAYAIQGLGSLLVERVEGDFSNVVGLPLRALFELVPELRRQGLAT